MKKKDNTKVAVIQSSPVIFDLEKTLEKTILLVHQTSADDPNLILLPESFIPAYPRGLDFGAVVGSRSDEGRALWQRYWENSMEVPGKATQLLGKAAKEAKAFVAIGITEREASSGTLFCSLLYFSPSGDLIGKHRKIKPTGSERVIWGEGDGSSLKTIDTKFGMLGGLICWENYMPLARMALYQQGIHIYLAPTADGRESWQHSMKHIAMEGRCFVLSCNQYVEKKDYPGDLQHLIKESPNVMSRGGSVIISPYGETLAGPLWDKDGILTAELDLTEITRARMDLDVSGHYSRPDLFDFKLTAPKSSRQH